MVFDQAEFNLMVARVQRARCGNDRPDYEELTVAAIALVEVVKELRTELAANEEIARLHGELSLSLAKKLEAATPYCPNCKSEIRHNKSFIWVCDCKW